MTPAHTGFSGFTLNTPTSLHLPGPWGVLVLMYPPAAYAEAIRLATEVNEQDGA